MKNILLIGTVIVLVGGAWYYFSSTQTTPPTEQEQSERMMEPTENIQPEAQAPDDETITAPVEATEVDIKVFTISGTNFAYDLSEIVVQEGDTVTINFESADGFHDWVVDEFSAATAKVRPGTPTSVTFIADKAGTYEYYCSVGSHRSNGMVGTLIVE